MRGKQYEDTGELDIMKVKREALVNFDTISIDNKKPVEKKLEEFASDKNNDLSIHLNEGYVVRVHFSKDDYSATDALKDYLRQVAELKY